VRHDDSEPPFAYLVGGSVALVMERHVLVSTHDTQGAAEAERDRLNQSSGHRPFRACIVIEPMAQRMGEQFALTTNTRRSRRAANHK
jgi:hypothetical protein